MVTQENTEAEASQVAWIILNTVKQLEVGGVIQGYTISIDVAKLGYEFYNLQIKLGSDAKEKHLKNFL